MVSRDRVAVYLLAGGRSRRLGRNKALVEVGGRPLLELVGASLAPVASSVTVVADRPDRYPELGLRVIADQRPGLGPLAGLEAALADLGDGWLLLASCDLVGLETRWLASLLAARGPQVQAVAFRGERWQPMPALFHTSAGPVVAGALERGELALWRTLDALGAVQLAEPEGWSGLVDVDDAPALARLRRG